MATTYAIPDGRVAMAATLWTGAGASTMTITNTVNGVGMQPDMVWVKSRSNAYDHVIWNSVVGAGTTTSLNSNTTSAEGAYYGNANLTSFNSNGFSTGATSGTNVLNANGVTNVGWQWKAGGTAVSNTAGSITSSVSANPTAGFSVVTFTGNATAGSTVGHGLGVAPQFVIYKGRNDTNEWWSYHIGLTSAAYAIPLNRTSAENNTVNFFNSTAPSSSVLTLGYWSNVPGFNNSGTTYVAYCFAPVSGYSAFGKYTGNGSADGPFVYTNFRPRYVLIKSSSDAVNWYVYDTSRDTGNLAGNQLYPNLSNAEVSSVGIDILSNGFKVRYGASPLNASGSTYIYACFAETAFKFSNAR